VTSMAKRMLDRLGLRAPLSKAWAVAKNPRSLADGWRYRRDYTAFKTRYGHFLREGKERQRPDKRLLVMSLHDHIPTAKEEAVFAKALQLHGYTPFFLVRRKGRILPYLRLFGYEDFAYFSEFVEAVDARPLEEEARRILARDNSFRDWVGWRYRDVHIGRHVLSSISRQLYRGRLDLHDPQVADLLARLVPEAMRAVHAAEALFDAVRPDLVLFNERGYTPYGEIFDVALNRKINTIQWCASHRDDARIFKRYTAETHGVHPHSLSDESWEIVQRMPWTEEMEGKLLQDLRAYYETGSWFGFQRLQRGKPIKTPEEVREQLGLDPAKKTAVIFAHIFWDATFFYGESLFDDYEGWFVETVLAACESPAVNWIVKLHPVNVWRLEVDNYRGELPEHKVLRERVGRLPSHVKLLEPGTDVNTFSLFDLADYCLTVRGTIGIEMAIFGATVFTAGTGRYSGRGFTVDSASREEYLDRLGRIHEFPRLSVEQVELARRYCYALLHLRPLRFNTIEPVFEHGKHVFQPLNGGIIIRARSMADLAAAPDLRAFAGWAADPNRLDYLAASDQ